MADASPDNKIVRFRISGLNFNEHFQKPLNEVLHIRSGDAMGNARPQPSLDFAANDAYLKYTKKRNDDLEKATALFAEMRRDTFLQQYYLRQGGAAGTPHLIYFWGNLRGSAVDQHQFAESEYVRFLDESESIFRVTSNFIEISLTNTLALTTIPDDDNVVIRNIFYDISGSFASANKDILRSINCWIFLQYFWRSIIDTLEEIYLIGKFPRMRNLKEVAQDKFDMAMATMRAKHYTPCVPEQMKKLAVRFSRDLQDSKHELTLAGRRLESSKEEKRVLMEALKASEEQRRKLETVLKGLTDILGGMNISSDAASGAAAAAAAAPPAAAAAAAAAAPAPPAAAAPVPPAAPAAAPPPPAPPAAAAAAPPPPPFVPATDPLAQVNFKKPDRVFGGDASGGAFKHVKAADTDSKRRERQDKKVLELKKRQAILLKISRDPSTQFIPSKYHVGVCEGYHFKRGDMGCGYYRDTNVAAAGPAAGES